MFHHRLAVATDKNHKRENNDNAEKIRYISIDIVESILTQMNSKDIMRVGAVCKDWRAISVRFDRIKRKIPWLITTNVWKATCRLQSVVDNEDTFKVKFPWIPTSRTLFYNCSNGWLVTEPDHYNPMILLNPFSSVWLQLPAFKPMPNSFIYMSSAPTDPNCILLARDYINLLYVWRPGDESWTLQGMLEPFETIISFKGQFYTWNRWSSCLTIFQVLPLRLKKLVVPCPFNSHISRVHNVSLVESCGNILLVYIMKHALQPVAIFLFQLDLENKVWIKKDSLGDQTLFMAIPRNQVISVSASEVGCSANCIYLTGVWRSFPLGEFSVYNMNNHTIKSFSTFVGHNQRRYGCNRLWITPSLS
ncbi:hypothetical protein MUK42_12361 [Musa troglodytarum]|uniref:F-box domain-containing protein n=3 Tax=Musa troglodytarum TaxID=320322 RepID=A0A9E7GND0_9LILI|nr:hypothetical protein MUK42_12361 [Musa troglodytarum]